MGLLSGLLGGALGLIGASKDAKNQKEAATHSVRWRVADANAAGVSPLYALGAPTMQFQSTYGNVGSQAGSDIGSGLEQMGQNIGRAKAAGASDIERASQRLALENAGLQNDKLRSEIAHMNSPGTPPAQVTQPLIPGQAVRDPDANAVGIILPGGGQFDTGASSPANTVENQYGDIVQNAYGTGRLVYDAVKNYNRVSEPYFRSINNRILSAGKSISRFHPKGPLPRRQRYR